MDGIHVEGNKKISSGDIEDKIATTTSPKFLGLFRGVVVDYSLFDRYVLARDLERIERYYRARGFYEAHARAGRVVYKNDKHVEVTIDVEEGEPTIVREIYVRGIETVPRKVANAAEAAIVVEKGRRFDEEEFHQSEEALKRALTDRGYAFAKVFRRADVDLVSHGASLVFDVNPGPVAKFGEVTFSGLGKLPEGPLRHAISLKPGQPYSTKVIDSAQHAILDLGVFSSVEVTPDLTQPGPDNTVPLRVHVVLQKFHGVELGGGFEIDELQTNLHLTAAWEDRNFLGGFRHFRVEVKPGGVLYPTRLPSLQAPVAVLPEEKTRLELRQPGLFEARTDGVFRSEFNAYPLLLTPQVDPDEPVLGWLEYKGSFAAERPIGRFFLAPSYNFQYDNPFAYRGTRDPDLSSVVVSYVEMLNHLDYRNDAVHPHKGFWIQNSIQFAGLGGNARDVRIQPEARGYIPLAKEVTLAMRGTFGLLFPMNYGTTLKANPDGAPDEATRADWIHDVEITYLRGFFSGGPSSNRGYALRSIGPHGAVPFLNPGVAAQQLAKSCDPSNPEYDPVRCAVPLGGETLWEASLELRFPIDDPFGAATFCDASDVAPDEAQFRLNHPHLSCGLGLRYDTPIGPVRADVGYRIPGAQVIGETVDPRVEGDPGTVFGLPMAVAIGIGEAF